MRVVIDIETNSLDNPTEIWCVVCKDIDNGQTYIFRDICGQDTSSRPLVGGVSEKSKLIEFLQNVTLYIGHHWLGYDFVVLNSLTGWSRNDIDAVSLDTFIISKLIDYSRKGHGVGDYGEEFGLPKGIPIGNELIQAKDLPISFYSKYSEDLEEYCKRDVEITHKIYLKYKRYIDNPDYQRAIRTEHSFQLICNQLHDNGFAFNTKKAQSLLEQVTKDLAKLDKDILSAFTPRSKLIREVTPKETKYGTISKSSIPKAIRDSLGNDLSSFSVGASFSYIEFPEFNPASHKQVIEVLNEAGWDPVEKTKTHLDTERQLKQYQYRGFPSQKEKQDIKTKIEHLKKHGWQISEKNLDTLPENAPTPARLLAQRILLESRRRTLTEWLGLVSTDNRIHGRFQGIGAWTHRMSHQNPNTANIPTATELDGSTKLLGKEMRSLWMAPKGRLLVGVDAESIQLRIFAHYINDQEFTDALVKGKKKLKTDPHSLNQRILGSVCKSRAASKRFIFALLLGAGVSKLSQILQCSVPEAEEALDNLIARYTGFAELKARVIPQDAKRGYFLGLDGRPIKIKGDTEGSRKHLAMSGYLQAGEAVVMKMACLKWHEQLKDVKNWKFVNFVHDEWQTECYNDMAVATLIAKIQAESLREVGEELKLNCPLAGSYYNDDVNDYTIGSNWYVTH